MFKKHQCFFIIFLCLTLLLSSSFTVSLAAGVKQQVMPAKSVSVVPPQVSAVPVPTVRPVPSQIEVQGTLRGDAKNLILVSGKTLYNLKGNTTGMEKYLGQQVIVKGTLKNSPVFGNAISINQTLYVQSYKPVIKPTPTIQPATPSPALISLQGKLEVNEIEGTHFELLVKDQVYVLTGKIDGIEKYIGQMVQVKGYIVDAVNIWMRGKVLQVIEYSPVIIQTPTAPVRYEVLQGYLKAVPTGPVVSENSYASYTFYLGTSDGAYQLIGNTKGLEQYNGKKVEVKGNYVYTFAPTEYPLFSVVSYGLVIEPTLRPTATPTAPQFQVLQGVLKVENILTNNPEGILPYPYIYTLETEKGPYTLQGNISGLEKYNGQKIEVKGTTQPWMIYPPVFEVVSYTVLSQPTPTQTPEYVVLQGTLKVLRTVYNDTSIPYMPYPFTYQLDTGKDLYALQGNTAGLEKYEGMKIEVKGSISPMDIYPTIFNVVSYRLISEPTPTQTPEYVVLQGTLKVTPADPWISSRSFDFELQTEKGPFILSGSTMGLEKYNGCKVEVKGTISPLTIYPPYFNVVSYRILGEPTPTPVYDVLQGSLSVTKVDQTQDTTVGLYRFLLKTAKGVYELIGNTKGLEQYHGKEMEVKGKYVMTLHTELNYILPTEYPMFSVVSYSLIVPTPTPVISSKVHTVISDKPLYLTVPKEGDMKVLAGNVTISWVENTEKAFFSAKFTTVRDIQKVDYEFELVTAKITDKESIKGLFSIKKDGIVIAKEVPGQVYGLSQPVNSYFKFYSDDMQWHMSAFITNRLDF